MTLTQVTKAGLHTIALDHVFTIGASGTDHYTFQGEGLNGTVNDPTLYLTRGKTYRFENGSGGHPIRIQSTSGASGTAYNTGVTNNAGSGTVIVEVQHDAPDVLYYQCTSHANMNGVLYITGALADGGVTTAKLAADAVNGTKIADNAVAAEHIAANAVGSSELADNAVDTNAIQNLAVTSGKIADSAITNSKVSSSAAISGTKLADNSIPLAKLPNGDSNNNGKFLRANNGADPSFETVSIPAGTTINNNADNRVITGSGTANTLNGESSVIIDANGKLGVGTTSPDNELQVQKTNAGGDVGLRVTNATGTDSGTTASLYLTTSPATDFNTTYLQAKRSDGSFNIGYGTDSPNVTVIGSTGSVGIGDTTPNSKLHVHSPAHYVTTSSGVAHKHIHCSAVNGNAGEYGGGISFSMGATGAAAIAARQGTSDGDVVGMSFFTHNSSDGSANAVEKVRIHDGGSVSFNDGIILGNSLTYNSANLLDDYEEGTFTAYLRSYYDGTSGQVASSDATYTKIGRKVFIQIRWLNPNTNGLPSGGSLIHIGNMPFQPDNNKKCITTDFATFNIDFHNTNARHVFESDSNGWYGQLNYSSGSWGSWAPSRWRTSAMYFYFCATYLTEA